MEERNDESIQRIVEAQLNGYTSNKQNGSEEEKLYQLVFEELSNYSIVKSTYDLSELVISKIDFKLAKKEAILYRLTITLSLIGGLLLCYIVTLLINARMVDYLCSFFKRKESIILFTICLFGSIQILDRLVKYNKIKKAVL